MEVAVLALAGSGTALATGFGALPVSRLGEHAATIRPALWGMTVGLMTVASVVGLLLPALDEGSTASVAAGLRRGLVFLLASRAAAEEARRARRAAERRGCASLGARVRRVARAQPARGLRDRHGVRVGDRGAWPLCDPRDRASERARGHQRRDPDGGGGLPPAPAVLGCGAHERAAAGRRARRLRRSWSRSRACCRSRSRSLPARCCAWWLSSLRPRRSSARRCACRSPGPAAGAALMLALAALLGV